MSKIILQASLATLAIVFTAATIDAAEAGGNGRKRGGTGQIMRLGGPANGATTNSGFVDRTGGPSLRTNREIERFFQQQRDNSGPG
jgi:hypothetical protein